MIQLPYTGDQKPRRILSMDALVAFVAMQFTLSRFLSLKTEVNAKRNGKKAY